MTATAKHSAPALPNTRESFKDIEITRFRANL